MDTDEFLKKTITTLKLEDKKIRSFLGLSGNDKLNFLVRNLDSYQSMIRIECLTIERPCLISIIFDKTAKNISINRFFLNFYLNEKPKVCFYNFNATYNKKNKRLKNNKNVSSLTKEIIDYLKAVYNEVSDFFDSGFQPKFKYVSDVEFHF